MSQRNEYDDDVVVIVDYLYKKSEDLGLNLTRDQVANMYKKQILEESPQLLMFFGLQEFTPEILQAIANQMEGQHILKLCLVSKRFNETICNDQKFWIQILRRDFISTITYVEDINYKQLYIGSITVSLD
jgi:hypothetical protein